jgi:lipoprotein-anchoring transpeptidase ErfK/SrfK
MRCLPTPFVLACRRHGVRFSRDLLLVRVQSQRMEWLQVLTHVAVGQRAVVVRPGTTALRRRYLISTSRFGMGQVRDTNRTPLGLHRIARKAGGGWPIGVVLKNRKPVGFTWQGQPTAAIAHRVFWLEGLEPGFNRGGDVDTFHRYIYVHGVGDELTLGRPASRGCVHLAAADLMPLYDRLPVGTLVWISAR